jgi:hypothetical protein
LVSVARIGQSCKLLSKPAAGWVKVDCGAGQGFTKQEFLADVAPDAAALEKQIGELPQSTPPDQKLNLLQRAIALGASNIVRDQFREAYSKSFEAQAEEAEHAEQQVGVFGFEIPSYSQDAAADMVNLTREHLEKDPPRALWSSVEFPSSGEGLSLHWIYYGSLYDGSLLVEGGDCETAGGTRCVIRVRSLSVPGPNVAESLGLSSNTEHGVLQHNKDACPAVPPSGSTLLCEASPGPKSECASGADVSCHTCKVACASTCNVCRGKCKVASYETCSKPCVSNYDSCAASCESARQKARESCPKTP